MHAAQPLAMLVEGMVVAERSIIGIAQSFGSRVSAQRSGTQTTPAGQLL
jgi:hypothetical protein